MKTQVWLLSMIVMDNVCQGLLPKGEYHHWQVFFSLLKRFFLPSVRSAQCPAARTIVMISRNCQMASVCRTVGAVSCAWHGDSVA